LHSTTDETYYAAVKMYDESKKLAWLRFVYMLKFRLMICRIMIMVKQKHVQFMRSVVRWSGDY
jgi:hypothetical protein